MNAFGYRDICKSLKIFQILEFFGRDYGWILHRKLTKALLVCKGPTRGQYMNVDTRGHVDYFRSKVVTGGH